MSRISHFRTILPTSSRAAVGATVAGGMLTGLATAPERVQRLFRRRYPTVADADQKDTDEDGLGDLCDDNDDGDEIPDEQDECPLDPDPNCGAPPEVPLEGGGCECVSAGAPRTGRFASIAGLALMLSALASSIVRRRARTG